MAVTRIKKHWHQQSAIPFRILAAIHCATMKPAKWSPDQLDYMLLGTFVYWLHNRCLGVILVLGHLHESTLKQNSVTIYPIMRLFAHWCPQANGDSGWTADFRQGFADVPLSTPEWTSLWRILVLRFHDLVFTLLPLQLLPVLEKRLYINWAMKRRFWSPSRNSLWLPRTFWLGTFLLPDWQASPWLVDYRFTRDEII